LPSADDLSLNQLVSLVVLYAFLSSIILLLQA